MSFFLDWRRGGGDGSDGTCALDECKKAVEAAARAGALVLCVLESEEGSGAAWLDNDQYSWCYRIKLPAGAGLCAALVPRHSQLPNLPEVCLRDCSASLLACWQQSP